MKRYSKLQQGVTLLEIMLVLAIAAMIIVMSVRYYQSAQASSQANGFIAQVQTITSTVENLAQGTGVYSGISQAQISSVMPLNGLITPWSGTITFTAASNGYSLAVSPAPPAGVCALITAKLTSSIQYVVGSGCGSVTFTAQ